MYGQPTQREHDDDHDDHVRDASLVAHALGRATSAGRRAVEQTFEQAAVQETDGRERQHVAEREETAVEDPALSL